MTETEYSRRVLGEARRAVSGLLDWIETAGIVPGAQAPLPERVGYPKGPFTVVRAPSGSERAVGLFYDGQVLTGSLADDAAATKGLAFQLANDPLQQDVRKAFQASSDEVRRETAETERQVTWGAEHADAVRRFRDHLLARGHDPAELVEDLMFAGLPAVERTEKPSREKAGHTRPSFTKPPDAGVRSAERRARHLGGGGGRGL